MSWAFDARGTLEDCRAQLAAGKPPSDPADAEQYERMRDVIDAELSHYGAGSTDMSISASGGSLGARSFSIWVSGRAAPVVAAAPAHPEAPSPAPEHAEARPIVRDHTTRSPKAR